jgi:hypothetical protein
MQPINYFKKTFVFVFIFIVVSRFVYQLFLEDLNTISLNFVLKIFATAFITALILGIINFYAKMDFLKAKEKQESKDNN